MPYSAKSLPKPHLVTQLQVLVLFNGSFFLLVPNLSFEVEAVKAAAHIIRNVIVIHSFLRDCAA